MTDLRALTAGRTYPDISRLDCLQALITDYADNRPGVDPEAEAWIISECQGLLDDMRSGAEAGRTLGRSKSAAKTAAARENGKRGGRPRGSKNKRSRLSQSRDGGA